MDPLFFAAYSSTAPGRLTRDRKVEDAFYRRHGGPILRRAFPAVPTLAIAAVFVVAAGLIG
ncbi:MAG TPA: hypothetical protein VFK86_15600 [Bauldia sp.]|nr:hypothetical protein [Bauldia sp.]